MASTVGYPTLSTRAISQEKIQYLRTICDEHKFGYGTFCSIIVGGVLADEELTQKFIQKTHQFEDDQQPASIAEMKELREKMRQYEDELAQLRAFKEAAGNSLNGQKAVSTYR